MTEPNHGEQERVDNELKAARRRLLDLTLRNRLLNHKRTKRRTISIIDEKPRFIYQSLVIDRKPMRFSPIALNPSQESSVNQDETLWPVPWKAPKEDSAVPEKHTDLTLQTNLDRDELFRHLFALHNDSETLLDEQGSRSLFLALGFLQWSVNPNKNIARTESEDRQLAIEKPRLAPLLLVPVFLERSGARKSFKVRWTEEELVENISLKEKLETEFGVTLPDLPEVTSKDDVINHFKSVSSRIRDREGWLVTEDVVIDIFNYSKFVMYRDLDSVPWPKENNPTKNSLLIDLFNSSKEPSDTGESFNKDEIDSTLKPSSVYHVLDADPSQIAAIEKVKEGHNLVVQGPPGTGKSQTITNLIAELMAAGKSVLFVCEKMAALEVVKSRLEQVGLGSFCVEVHSRKSNKRAFLKQLENSVSQPSFPLRNYDSDFADLEDCRVALNEYARALREPLEAMQRSPSQLFGDFEKAKAHFRSQSKPKEIDIPSALDQTPDNLRKTRNVLKRWVSVMADVTPVPQNPWKNSRKYVWQPAGQTKLRNSLEDTLQLVLDLNKSITLLAGAAGVPKAVALSGVETMRKAAIIVGLPPKNEGALLIDRDVVTLALEQKDEEMKSFVQAMTKGGTDTDHILLKLKPEALQIDADSLTERWKTYGFSWLRWTQWRYWSLRREIKTLYFSNKVSAKERVLEDLGALSDAIRVHDWLDKYTLGVIRNEIEIESIGKIFDVKARETIVKNCELLTKLPKGFREYCNEIESALEFDKSAGSPNSNLEDSSFKELEGNLRSWLSSVDGLPPWGAYLQAREKVEATIGKPLAALVHRGEINPEDVLETFNFSLARCALNSVFESQPALARFTTAAHEDLRREFANLDHKLIKANQIRLKAKLIKRQPPLSAAAPQKSEAWTLRRQFQIKRNHLPIRKLMLHCGDFIRRMTPCFMMSPLSVAQFLDPRCDPFDVVIFDEASQVCTEDAIGSFLRAKQAVVIGDRWQLPPTNFFSHMISDDDADDLGSAGDMDSILNLCSPTFLGTLLSWHYRSKHETLIAASNELFYDGDLLIYPSPIDKAPGLGLEHRYLRNNLYGRGASTINRGEAEAVADAAIKHYQNKNTRDLSLGIGTFSSAQQKVIQQELDERLRNEPGNFDRFFNRSHREYCFIKNLETIQGDERDVIYVSVGYGHNTDTPSVSNTFGPVTHKGGERRLNVLFTRARKHCVIFSNFRADDMKVSEKASRGVQVLQTFLRYAESRKLNLAQVEGAETDSPFEDSVEEVLHFKGYQVARQVGCAGYRIDLAVRDPNAPGRYVIGIECDGAPYHSSYVARERDRLRQEILEQRGWRIHRVWSTDWYRGRRLAEDRLVKAVEDALHSDYAIPVPEPEPDSEDTAGPVTWILPPSGDFQRLDAELKGEDYTACVSLNPKPSGELHLQPTQIMKLYVEEVVRVESPIHSDLLIARIRELWGLARAGNRIKEKIKKGISSAKRSGAIRSQGKFLWRPDHKTPTVRRGGSKRPGGLEFVCDEEIREGIKAVQRDDGKSPEGALVLGTARRLGIQSTSKDIKNRIRRLVNELQQEGVIRLI